MIPMVLAIWGFISYVYQHYFIDDKTEKKEKPVKFLKLALLEEGYSNIQPCRVQIIESSFYE